MNQALNEFPDRIYVKLELRLRTYNNLRVTTLQECCNYHQNKSYKMKKFRGKVECKRKSNMLRYRSA